MKYWVFVLAKGKAAYHVGITTDLPQRLEYYNSHSNIRHQFQLKEPLTPLFESAFNDLQEGLALKKELETMPTNELKTWLKHKSEIQQKTNFRNTVTAPHNQLILPTSYLGNFAYFNQLKGVDELIIDSADRFDKQTLRNRCLILTANGLLNLTVPVTRPNGKNTAVGQVLINYKEDWQKDHLKAIESAYRNAPFYSFYASEIFAIIRAKHHKLADLNNALTQCIANLLGLNLTVRNSASGETCTVSAKIELAPKNRKQFQQAVYRQVFEPTGQFETNLSILDYLFNVGKLV